MSNQEFYVYHNVSNIDLYPIQFGRENCDPLHHYGPAITHNYLFHYILSGKGTFTHLVGGPSHQLVAGQGFLMPPDHVCSYEADADDPWTYCWVEFNGLKAANFMKQAGFNETNFIFTPKQTLVTDNITRPFETLITNHRQHETFIIGQLYLLIDGLIRCSLHSQQPVDHSVQNFYIRTAIDFVERNYQQNISVDDLATHCNLNRNYFARLFKQELHITPSQFIQNYRLNLACELLTSTKLPIHTVAEKVGYANQFNFSAAFKKAKHLSPFEWRKRYS